MGKAVLAWLAQQNEDHLRLLLKDLLRAMGYLRVTITHGTAERGRDLVFLEEDRLGRQVWRGVQAKAQKIGGSYGPGGLATAINQCKAGLVNPYQVPSGEVVLVQEMWLVMSEALSEQAKLSIQSELHTMRGVVLVDGAHLTDLVERYLPELVAQEGLPIEHYLAKLLEYCDSVENYVASQAQTRFSLPDVFIEPRLSVRFFARPGDLGAFNVRKLLGFEVFAAAVDLGHRLAGRGVLPALIQFQIASGLEELEQFAASFSALPIFSVEVGGALTDSLSRVREVCAHIVGALGREEGLRGEVTEEMLAGIERSLVRPGDRLTKAIEDYLQISNHPDVFSGAAGVQSRFRIEANHRQFLVALKAAFNTSTNPNDPLTQLGVQAAAALAGGEFGEDRVHVLLREVEEDLERVNEALRDYLLGLRAIDAPGSLTGDLLREIGNREQLVRFLETLAGPLQEDYLGHITMPALELSEKVDRLVVVADLGQGKTTLLKQLGKRWLERVLAEEQGELPLFCGLSALGAHETTDIVRELRDVARERTPALAHVAQLEIAWLLDGFDEVKAESKRADILTWIRGDQGPNRFVMATRPSALRTFIPRVLVTTLEPLATEDIARLVGRFPWRSADEPERLIEVLTSTTAFREIVRNPLLLTLVILVAQSRGVDDLPTRREALFDSIVRLFLGEWDLQKQVEKTYSITSLDERRALLRRIAYRLYARGERRFTSDVFVEAAINATSLHQVSIERALRFLGELVRDSVVVPVGGGSFGFFHLSMQEFLAAEELRNDVTPERLFNAITEFLSSGSWWEEVLVFYAGLARDISGVINTIHEKSMEFWLSGTVSPDFTRLLGRMLDVANFTEVARLRPQRAVAQALAMVNYAGEHERWMRFARASMKGAFIE